MNKMSLIDKIKILIEVSKNSYWFLIAILFLIGYGIVLLKTNKINQKRNKKIYLLFSLSVLVLLIVFYHSSINHLLNYLMDNIFISIMFPNIAIYFLGIVITNIILWISLFYEKTSKTIKRINILVYLILNYLLILVLNTIDVNNIDVFSQNSIYHNDKATALIELSTLIFSVWIVYLILYKIILVYIRKDYKEKVKKVVVKKTVKKLPENYEPVQIPDIIFGNAGKRITLINPNPNSIIQEYEKKLTLQDYQLLLKIYQRKN